MSCKNTSGGHSGISTTIKLPWNVKHSQWQCTVHHFQQEPTWRKGAHAHAGVFICATTANIVISAPFSVGLEEVMFVHWLNWIEKNNSCFQHGRPQRPVFHSYEDRPSSPTLPWKQRWRPHQFLYPHYLTDSNMRHLLAAYCMSKVWCSPKLLLMILVYGVRRWLMLFVCFF